MGKINHHAIKYNCISCLLAFWKTSCHQTQGSSPVKISHIHIKPLSNSAHKLDKLSKEVITLLKSNSGGSEMIIGGFIKI